MATAGPNVTKTSEDLLKEVSLKVDRARWWALNNQPFYGSLASQLEDVYATVIIDSRTGAMQAISTAATDGVRIFWNPNFVARLSDQEIRFVLLHETLHVGHFHLWRLPPGQKGNIAGDYVINLTLSKLAGVKMPACGLLDAKYDGMAEEEVLRALPDDEKQESKDGQSGSGDSQNGDSGNGNGGFGGEIGKDPGGCGGFLPPAPHEAQDEKKDSSDKGKSGDGPKQKDGNKKGSGDGNGDESGDESGDAAEARTPTPEQLRARWEQALLQAEILARTTQRGTVPGDMERQLRKVRAQEVDWRQETVEFVKTSITHMNDWTRAARRHSWQSVVYPRRRRDGLGLVVFARDLSGSVDDRLGSEITALIDACLGETGCEGIVLDHDTYVRKEYRLAPGDECPKSGVGGGGTDFRPTFTRIREIQEETGETIAGIIYLTDGFGSEPEEKDVTAPLLWVLCGPYGAQEPMKTGKTIRVETMP